MRHALQTNPGLPAKLGNLGVARAFVLLCAAALCGMMPPESDGNGGNSQGPSSASYFPLANGFHWTYVVTGDSGPGYLGAQTRNQKLEIRVLNKEEAEVWAGPPAGAKRIGVWRLAGGWTGADFVVQNPDGVQIYARNSEEGGPLPVATLVADLRWGGLTKWASGPPAGHIGHIDGKRLAVEGVKVPAGRFQCVRIDQDATYWQARLWLAPNVGIVKQVLKRRWGNKTKQEVWELTAYQTKLDD